MSRSRPALALPVALALLAGCGDDEPVCTPELEKRAVLDHVYDWYLYPETLPALADVDLARYATPDELLWELTRGARELDMDRGWSWLTTAAAAQTYFEEGKTVGFGIGFVVRDGALRVSQVYPGSAATAAGLRRGDTVARIGETEATLQEVAPVLAADLEQGTSTVGALFGPAEPGVERALEVVPAGGGQPVVRVLTKGTFGLDPVPAVGGPGDAGQRWRIEERDGKKLGYVALRTFVATADGALVDAFKAFKAAGVTGVVVDLRYNGGGLVATGELLANLLAGDLAGSTMVRWTNNPLHAGSDVVDPFAPRADASLAPERVAFITTGASASASELVPNVMEPWRAVKLVGAKTYGKPVGQRALPIAACDAYLYLVSFKLENSEGDGEFFAGLPDAAFEDATLCDAEDDLLHALGDPAEASTGAALDWLATGACPAAAVAGAAKLRAAGPRRDAYPVAPEPSVAQRHLPGLF